MPYSSTEDLPDQTKNLSSAQKRAFMHAFNSALDSGKGEKSAFKIAWSAANGVSKHLPGKHDQSDHGSWAKEKITGGMTKEKREGILKEINEQGGSVRETLEAANRWLMKMGKADNSIEFGVTVDDKGVARDVFMGREGVVRFGGIREPGLMGFLRGKKMDRLHLTHLHPIKEGAAAAYKPLSEQDVIAATLTGAKSITAVTPQGFKSTFEMRRPSERKKRKKQLKQVFNAIGEHEVAAFNENWSGLMSDEGGWSGFQETRRNIKEFKGTSDRSKRVKVDHASRKSDDKWQELLNAIPGVTYTSGRITKRVGDVNENSSYAKNMDELTIEGEIAKVDDDQRQIFGWASVTEINGEPVVDLQGDVMETYELEKAAYDYVLNSRVGGEMHERVGKTSPKQVGTLIESMVITPEKIEKMGLPASTPHGWWIGFQVDRGDVGETVWKKVKKGDYTGFSIHGLGKRQPMEKHLIGRHNQKDHGRRHGRDEHEGIFRSGRAAELRRDLAERAARLAEEEPEPRRDEPKAPEKKPDPDAPPPAKVGDKGIRIDRTLPSPDDLDFDDDDVQPDLFDEWARTFDRASEIYEDSDFEVTEELEDLTSDLMRIERELEGHLEKKMAGISKGVMTRDPSAYIEWLEKISSVSGITPKQIDQDLRGWMKDEGVEDPSDDDVHDFLITAYGSGEEGEVTKAVIKHLIGRHNQKDHDPTKGGHSRSDHQGFLRGSKQQAAERTAAKDDDLIQLMALEAQEMGVDPDSHIQEQIKGATSPEAKQRAEGAFERWVSQGRPTPDYDNDGRPVEKSMNNVHKHLIGRHDQKDHGNRHSRKEHKGLLRSGKDAERRHSQARRNRRRGPSPAEEFADAAGVSFEEALPMIDRMTRDMRRRGPDDPIMSSDIAAAIEAIRRVDPDQEPHGGGIIYSEPEYKPDPLKSTTVSGVAGPIDIRSTHDIRRQRDEEEQGVIRKFLVYKARERAKTLEEFAANVEEIGKALEGVEPEMAGYFDDVHKHLIGRHEQGDHDPNKKGSRPGGHTRQQHKGKSPTGSQRNPSFGAAAGGLAGAGLGALRGASMGPVGLIGGALGGALGGGGLGYQLGGGQIFGNPGGSRAGGIAAGTGNIMVGGAGGITPAVRRMMHGDPNEMYAQQRHGKRRKKLNKRQREVLEKYLGPIGDEDAE